MTLDELNEIEKDLRKAEAKFPNDYSTAKAFQLAAALRPLLTPKETQNQMEIRTRTPTPKAAQ